MELKKAYTISDLINSHRDAMETLQYFQENVDAAEKKLDELKVKRDSQLAYTQDLELKIKEIDG